MTNPESATSTTTGPGPGPKTEPPVWPYVVPLAGFLALTALEGYLPTAPGGAPSTTWYPIGYTLKLVAVSALLWHCRVIFNDLRPWPTVGSLGLSVLVGLGVTAAWVGLDGLYPAIPFLSGRRTEFDPTTLAPAARSAFLAVRVLGLVVIVPLIEELFYRSFLMRWLVDPDYRKVPIGLVTPVGLAVTSGVFAFSHPEWLPALLTGLAWGGLVWKTRSVLACVVSHATANLALAVYVIAKHAWKFW
jgi:uncharacterized protein